MESNVRYSAQGIRELRRIADTPPTNDVRREGARLRLRGELDIGTRDVRMLANLLWEMGVRPPSAWDRPEYFEETREEPERDEDPGV